MNWTRRSANCTMFWFNYHRDTAAMIVKKHRG